MADYNEKGVDKPPSPDSYGKEKSNGAGVTVSDVKRSDKEFYDPSKESVWTRLGLNFESYKRAPGVTAGQAIEGQANVGEDLERRLKDSPMLQAKMKPRHLQMIAVGGSIGTGLFIGSGGALQNGGPAGILIAWIIIGVMMINVTQALGEVCILYPVSGGFYTLAYRFLDPAFAFAMGWNYFLQWLVTLPVEITAAGITVQYWERAAAVPIAVWITVFWVSIVRRVKRSAALDKLQILLNVFGTLGYAEEEFFASLLKLLVAIMFVIASVVFICGGGPASGEYSSYVGGRYWQDPGAFANGFKGVCAVFVTAAFSFAGTEIVGLAASETPNPRQTMPSAVKNTFWRVTIIYISTLTVIGLLLPYTEDRLGGSDARASPFVLVFSNANVSGLDSLVNVTICISVLSIGLSCVYAGSRTLTALAETGFAPKMFRYVDKSGRPLFSVLVILAFGAVSYVNVGESGGTVFNWLLAISGLSTLVTWGSICLIHIRFRKAWRVQGHSVEELPFKALGGVWGSWLGLILVVLVLIAQFYVAVWPIGEAPTGADAAQTFFQAYLAAPIILAFWIGGYAWKRTRPLRAHEIDLDSGRKSWLTVADMQAYRAERAKASFPVKCYRILFSN